ncbi:MAG: hypothetical protein AAF715_22470 [Myxococcota bacterium]
MTPAAAAAETAENVNLYARAERAAVLTALLRRGDDGVTLQQRTAMSVVEAEHEVASIEARLEGNAPVQQFYRRRVEHLGRVLGRGSDDALARPPSSPSPRAWQPPPNVEGIDVTGPVDFAQIGRDPLPFDPHATPQLPPPVVYPARASAGETAVVDLAAVMSTATPFERGGAPAAVTPPVNAEAPPASASEPKPDPPLSTVDETGVLDPSVLASLGPALPFAAAPPGSSPPVRLSSTPTRPRDPMGGTAVVPPERRAGPPAPATPFESMPPAAPPQTPPPAPTVSREASIWTEVRRYASFRVDMKRAPGEGDRLRRHYGLRDLVEQAELEAEYNRRFGEDANLVAAYQEAVATYVASRDTAEEERSDG